MTDEDGKILTECHTKMALLDTHYKSLGKEVGELGQRVDGMAQKMVGFEIAMNGLSDDIKEKVLPAIENIPGAMSLAINNHEKHDPIHSAVNAKTRADITNVLRTKMKSDPPKPDPELVEIKKQSLITKNKLYAAIAGLLIAATGLIGGTQIQSCSNQERSSQIAAEKTEK